MWSSRHNLVLSASALLLAIVLLRRYEPEAERAWADESPEAQQESTDFMTLLREAEEELDYLHASVLGRAEIAPVVEKRQEIVLGHACRTLRNARQKVAPVHEWVQHGRFWVFGAHLDERRNSLFPENAAVQVIAATFHHPKRAPWCLLRGADGAAVAVVRAVLRSIWQRAWDPRAAFYNSYLVTCAVPEGFADPPVSVTLLSTASHCTSELPSALPVQRHRVAIPRTHDALPRVGVCLKGLAFLADDPQPLAEWIEFQKFMGAETVVVYVYNVPPETRKLLDGLRALNEIELVELRLPGEAPSVPFVRHNFIWRNRQQKRRAELIPYNDCFLRLAPTHDFVLVADSDEFVVPRKHNSWPEMLAALRTEAPHLNTTSYAIRNVFKLATFAALANTSTHTSSHLRMLQVDRRSKLVQDKGISEKSFISTKTIATVFNHFALHRLTEHATRTQHVPPETALKLHYKPACPEELGAHCAAIVAATERDDSLDRFAQKFEARVAKVMERLKTA